MRRIGSALLACVIAVPFNGAVAADNLHAEHEVILKCEGTGVTNIPRWAGTLAHWVVIYKLKSPKQWLGWNTAENQWDEWEVNGPSAIHTCENSTIEGRRDECNFTAGQFKRSQTTHYTDSSVTSSIESIDRVTGKYAAHNEIPEANSATTDSEYLVGMCAPTVDPSLSRSASKF